MLFYFLINENKITRLVFLSFFRLAITLKPLTKILEKQLWEVSVKKYEKKKKKKFLNVLNLYAMLCIKFLLRVTKCLHPMYEILEKLFVKTAIEKNFQATASEINIICKELSVTTLRLRKISSPGKKTNLL